MIRKPKIAIMGTFWKTRKQAEDDMEMKTKRFGRPHAVISYTNGYLTVPKRVLKYYQSYKKIYDRP